MAFVQRLRGRLTLSAKASRRIDKLGQPLVNIARDYRDTFADLKKHFKEHPWRSACYAAMCVLLQQTWRRKPDSVSYFDTLVVYSNELSMVASTSRNQRSERYISKLVHQHSRLKLMYVNLGVLALIVERRSYPDVKSFPESCPQLRQPWWTVHRNIVDVGVWGSWRNIHNEMVDFDVNEEEWNSS